MDKVVKLDRLAKKRGGNARPVQRPPRARPRKMPYVVGRAMTRIAKGWWGHRRALFAPTKSGLRVI
jgi:hypothetical protein